MGLTNAREKDKVVLGDPRIPMSFQYLSSVINTAPSIGDIQLGLLVSRGTSEEARDHPLFLHEPRSKIDTLLLSVSINQGLIRIVCGERFEPDRFRRRIGRHGACAGVGIGRVNGHDGRILPTVARGEFAAV